MSGNVLRRTQPQPPARSQFAAYAARVGELASGGRDAVIIVAVMVAAVGYGVVTLLRRRPDNGEAGAVAGAA